MYKENQSRAAVQTLEIAVRLVLLPPRGGADWIRKGLQKLEAHTQLGLEYTEIPHISNDFMGLVNLTTCFRVQSWFQE
jgi:hypothetical protein